MQPARARLLGRRLRPAPFGVYRAWSGLCVSGLLPRPAVWVRFDAGLDRRLAVPYAVAVCPAPEGIPEGARQESDLPGTGRSRSEADRAVHGRGKASE